jgi:hypothetical protein
MDSNPLQTFLEVQPTRFFRRESFNGHPDDNPNPELDELPTTHLTSYKQHPLEDGLQGKKNEAQCETPPKEPPQLVVIMPVEGETAS